MNRLVGILICLSVARADEFDIKIESPAILAKHFSEPLAHLTIMPGVVKNDYSLSVQVRTLSNNKSGCRKYKEDYHADRDAGRNIGMDFDWRDDARGRSVPVRLRHENQTMQTSIEGLDAGATLRHPIDARWQPVALAPEGLVLNAQKHLSPVIGLGKEAAFKGTLARALDAALGVTPDPSCGPDVYGDTIAFLVGSDMSPPAPAVVPSHSATPVGVARPVVVLSRRMRALSSRTVSVSAPSSVRRCDGSLSRGGVIGADAGTVRPPRQARRARRAAGTA